MLQKEEHILFCKSLLGEFFLLTTAVHSDKMIYYV